MAEDKEMRNGSEKVKRQAYRLRADYIYETIHILRLIFRWTHCRTAYYSVLRLLRGRVDARIVLAV